MSKECCVRVYHPSNDCPIRKPDGWCPMEERCRIGCFKPARHLNPFFGKDFYSEEYWWRGGYGYCEWLCAECYDQMVSWQKETEDFYRDADPNYEENPEYTRLLESL